VKTVILSGGLGTRLSEETQLRPKPMVEIGGKPILWHIMSIYENFGYKDFVLALGYKSDFIKDYFYNYHVRQSDLVIELKNNKVEYLSKNAEDWRITMIDTGKLTMTGGRLLRLKPYLYDGGTFMLTYGDGVSDIDIEDLVKFHKSHGKIATVTSVRPPVRFGELLIEDFAVTSFQEKPQSGEGWINGGFFVFEPEIFDFLTDDYTLLERDPMEQLANRGELMAYKHTGFWQCMDTIRDRDFLQELIHNNSAPWIR
jgi:glucose-1-phosphate cytidylyltransferase